MKKLLLIILLQLPITITLFPQSFNALTFYPTLEGDGISGMDSRIGEAWDFHITTMVIYEKSPLQIGSSRNDTKDVIPHLLVTYWGASLNLPYNLQGYLLIPWDTYAKINDPINDIKKTISSLGDISFGVKYSRISEWPLPGLAIAMGGIVPSGLPEYYLGTPSFQYRFILIGDYLLGRHYFYVNLLYTARKEEKIANLDLDDQFGYILGYSFPRGNKVTFTAEIRGATVIKHIFRYEPLNPLEINGKLRFSENAVDWGIIAGTGLTKGIGVPDYRIGIFLSYPSTNPETLARKILPETTDFTCLKYFSTPTTKRIQNNKCAKAEFGFVTGKVETFSGFPISNALVIIQPGNMQVRVDEKGHFTIKLRPGVYYIKANKHKFTSTEAFIELRSREVKKITLKMRYIEGTLIVRLYNYKLKQIGGIISIYSGTKLLKRYRISHLGAMIKLPPGEYIIVGGIPGIKKTSKIADIQPGGKTEVDLIIK